jgi:hypothetical protein
VRAWGSADEKPDKAKAAERTDAGGTEGPGSRGGSCPIEELNIDLVLDQARALGELQ